jgi:hypothetical protein
MQECGDRTGSRIEIENRLAELDRLDDELRKQKGRFRALRENSLVEKIEIIKRLINLIYRSTPGAIARARAAFPRWPGRRRLRRVPTPPLRWPPYP